MSSVSSPKSSESFLEGRFDARFRKTPKPEPIETVLHQAVNRAYLFSRLKYLSIIFNMITVSVLYPKSASSHFDHEYYNQKHIPLVRSLWSSLGLERIELLRGMAALDGSPPAYELIGVMTFLSIEHLQDALRKSAEVLADIPNFTNVQPLVQTNQPVIF